MTVYNNVSEKDILEYWKTLFPEIKRERELEKIIDDFTDYRLDEVGKIWESQGTDNSEFMKWLFRQENVITPDHHWDRYICDNHINNIFYPLFLFQKEKMMDLKETLLSNEFFKEPEKIYESAIEEVLSRLREVSVRTFITEIHMEKKQSHLKGKNRSERFFYYTDHVWRQRDYICRFYSEYKELLELQLNVFDDAYESFLELIDRIALNYARILELIESDGENISITDIQMGLGDAHCAGRTVALVSFSNGKKLIYKPRSLKAEIGFRAYSRAINRGMGLGKNALYSIKAITDEEYGFMEYISMEECGTKEQLERFYYRAGIITAMLYSLNARDIHHENMISHGEYPVMIDLEAIFHGSLEHKEIDHEKTAYELALDGINDSVYSIGLLPMNLLDTADKERAAVDISGFGGNTEQISPFKILMIQNRDTDEICLSKADYVIKPQKNNAVFKGNAVNASDYRDIIIRGFHDAYIYIMEHKTELIIGLREWFHNMSARIIYRPTYVYGRLMFTSSHPDFMREKAHRYILLHRLAYKVKLQEKAIVQSEISDILRGDVPLFEMDIETGRMKNSSKEILPVAFKKTPFDIVAEKIERFDRADLDKQIMIIDNAFLSKQVEEYRAWCMTRTKWTDTCAAMGKTDYLELAKVIGEKILDGSYLAEVKGESQLSWVNYIPMGDEAINYDYRPVECDLYSGTSGIGLYFLYLWKVSGIKKYLDAAYACMRPVITEMCEINEDSCYLTGPFNGLSGYIYVMSKFYLVAKDEGMIELIKDGLCKMKKIYFRDTNYDVISGSAGAIKVCLSVRKHFQGKIREMAEELILLLTRHLLKNKTELEDGSYVWKSGLNDTVYTGYAHGSVGIQDALRDVYRIWKIEEVRDVIDRSDRFVQKMYVREQKNWKTMIGRRDFSYAWCHGAPGIIYSISKQYKDMGSDERKGFLEVLQSMKMNALGNNICYCHGDIGNLELIRRIAQTINDYNLQKECECTYRQLVKKIPEYITEKSLVSYGLMLGLAGIGYSLLAAVSVNVPFILELE